MNPRIVAAVLLFGLAACGGRTDLATPTPTAPLTPTPAPAPTPAADPAATPAVTPTSEPTPPPAPPLNSVRFAAVGDIGDGNEVQRRVGERIAALHAERRIDVLLLLGDIIYPDGDGARYETNFARPWRAVLDAGIRMEAALGNHDVQTRSGADIMELFEMPHRYHAFAVGPVAFFALDSNRFDRPQLDWLRASLNDTTQPWRIPFLHAPAYSSGHHGSTTYVQRGLDPIAREYRIPLVLASHDHDYERTHPIGETVHVVAGTGCCLRPVGRSDFTAFAASEPGVVIGDVTGSTLELAFVHADGRVLDRARITLSEDAAVGEPARR